MFNAQPSLISDGFGAALLAALLWRAWRLQADGLYLLAYLGMILIWPYPEEAQRFLWVIVPIGLAQFALLLRTAPQPAMLADGLPTAFVVALLIIVLPWFARTAQRYEDGLQSDIEDAVHYRQWYTDQLPYAEINTRSRAAIGRGYHLLASYVPADGCVINIKPQVVMYLAHRRSILLPLHSGSLEDDRLRIRKLGCRYLFMVHITDLDERKPLDPLSLLYGQIEILKHEDVPDPPYNTPRTSYVIARFAK
jgi:hypothetical protein